MVIRSCVQECTEIFRTVQGRQLSCTDENVRSTNKNRLIHCTLESFFIFLLFLYRLIILPFVIGSNNVSWRTYRAMYFIYKDILKWCFNIKISCCRGTCYNKLSSWVPSDVVKQKIYIWKFLFVLSLTHSSYLRAPHNKIPSVSFF